ncbi:MAG TPA: glycosyl hydrolase [Bacteroidetes bacterium]|nr:glycosyl hydrolase [Bacteroidota bacterium]
MKKKSFFILPFLLFLSLSCVTKRLDPTQFSWQPVETGASASLRGIFVLNENEIWISGSGGFCARSADAGASWQKMKIPGADSLDFRDVQVFPGGVVYLLSAGGGGSSRIYKSADNGKSWILQFQNPHRQGFFSAMAFWDAATGLAFSDPVDGKFVIIKTENGGKNWREIDPANIPPAQEGEYAFAAGGTCLITQGRENAWFGSGGAAARVFRTTDQGETWQAAATPVSCGNQSSGIFSLSFLDAQNGIAVGGDYRQPDRTKINIAKTTDGGITWRPVADSHKLTYRSCVTFLPRPYSNYLIAVGRSGCDYSADGGETWHTFSKTGYYTMSFAKSGLTGWAAGSNGRVAKFRYRRK